MHKQELLESIAAGNLLKEPTSEIRQLLKEKKKIIVVLDDDPTGTQTVHNVPIITEWTEEIIKKEVLSNRIFFILTNSRSLPSKEANIVGKTIGQRLRTIAEKYDRHLIVVSRGDSTLRGHYPGEVNALAEGLNLPNAKHILVPAFFEGGRYTFKDVHYVQEKDSFTPAGETPFAKDNTFGYQSSNLIDWIKEKSDNKISSDTIHSLSVDSLRKEKARVQTSILENSELTHIISNATANIDLEKLALACLSTNEPLLYRTAASFVNAISGIQPKALLSKGQVLGHNNNHGALIVIGSYVPKTTEQLNYLKQHTSAIFIELNVTNVVQESIFRKETLSISNEVENFINSGKTVVLYTSRTIVKGETKEDSLKIVNLVSKGVIAIVQNLKTTPKYILAKGGITSSDIATKALMVRRAIVIGQISKGIPVWELGYESKFPRVPYIVFPGNVGSKNTLNDIIKLLE
ncbi:four-carbon acid sugar kinase family protein [uncultured Maribacter sp.]|uniref:four-carbon acid sugar kinase family protein n=1 Tax=uncultured Maribacter sp. TaxID=431308 RepID=UPI00260A78C8|nr:four-carbon acid sugar kinase family protein [uncultured Maribacter sp.]